MPGVSCFAIALHATRAHGLCDRKLARVEEESVGVCSIEEVLVFLYLLLPVADIGNGPLTNRVFE